MVEGTSPIRNQINEDITDMLRTRLAMAEKLELLEGRLQDTVAETKAAVIETVDSIRDTAEDFVERTKQSINPLHQVQQHPWMMLGAAVVGGFLFARLGHHAAQSGNGTCAVGPGEFPGTPMEARERDMGSPLSPRIASWQQELTNELMDQIQGEFSHVKGALLVAAQTFLRDIAKHALRLIAEPLERAVDRGSSNGGAGHSRY